MKKKAVLTVIKLLDKTVLYAKQAEFYGTFIKVKNFRISKNSSAVAIVEESMTISMNAVESYAILHRGDKKKEPKPGPYAPIDKKNAS